MRLDKMLSNMGCGSRTDIKKLCKQSQIMVNGETVKKPALKVDPNKDEIICCGKKIVYREFVYLMLNKPGGCVSATTDREHLTVVDLISEEYKAFDVFPVGRLDKDTEGLLILTNDGELSHDVLSPKKHVLKKYFVRLDKPAEEKDIKSFEEGVYIGEGYTTKPAGLEILEGNEAFITISEGKFHQVKRMFHSVGKEVEFLKRVRMGNLELDPELKPGEYRELSEEEILRLRERK